MTNEDEARIVAACEKCGSVYAALELSSGDVQPIGSRTGCTSCGGTTFVPLPQFTDDSGSPAADDDD
ncbi:hypothetical protein ACFQGT_10060 [Natrialbaceae archaeon GCM10025810]|uniref:hypothetical protein n=1 Tax=Halovalidus salilacus TaxID=3075124 RepID=UPI003616A710